MWRIPLGGLARCFDFDGDIGAGDDADRGGDGVGFPEKEVEKELVDLTVEQGHFDVITARLVCAGDFDFLVLVPITGRIVGHI